MTIQETDTVLRKYNSYWSITIDDLKMKDWHDVLQDQRLDKVLEAIVSLAKTYDGKYPTLHDIVQKISVLRQKSYDNRMAEQKKNTVKQFENLDKCIICNDKGIVFFRKIVNNYEYEFCARCTCGHGRDLNKFSRSQVNMDYCNNYNEKAKELEHKVVRAVYMQDIKESLGVEEYALMLATKKARNSGSNDIQEVQQSLKELVKSI